MFAVITLLAAVASFPAAPGGGVHGSPERAMAVQPVAIGAAELHAAAEPSHVNVGKRDVRLPRPPRHRAERPVTGGEDVEAITDMTLVSILADEIVRPRFIDIHTRIPLAGHPLSLLRPPSVSAA